MAGLNDDDFVDETNKKRNKMRISEAIEDEDTGKKKLGMAKKGKKKKRAGRKGQDADMLNVQQEEANDSWDSSRGQAKNIDLSN